MEKGSIQVGVAVNKKNEVCCFLKCFSLSVDQKQKDYTVIPLKNLLDYSQFNVCANT